MRKNKSVLPPRRVGGSRFFFFRTGTMLASVTQPSPSFFSPLFLFASLRDFSPAAPRCALSFVFAAFSHFYVEIRFLFIPRYK